MNRGASQVSTGRNNACLSAPTIANLNSHLALCFFLYPTDTASTVTIANPIGNAALQDRL